MGRKIEVDEDELKFILKQVEELEVEFESFMRKRFGIGAVKLRLQGILGQVSDPDKTPVRPPFPPRNMTKPGGHKIVKKGNDNE